jgi:hypothetical protein
VTGKIQKTLFYTFALSPSFAHRLQNSTRSQLNLFHPWINLYSLSQNKLLIHKPLSLITKTRIRGLDAFKLAPRLPRALAGTSPPRGAWWTDTSLTPRIAEGCWLALDPHRRDISTCSRATRSRSVRSLWWARRVSGATGSESPSSRAAAAATFWLARAKSGGPSSSSRILPFTLQALARVHPPSPQRPISCSSLACSCSSWRHASSSSFSRSPSCSSRTHGRAWFLSRAQSSEMSGGVFPSWTLSTCPLGGGSAMKHSREG